MLTQVSAFYWLEYKPHNPDLAILNRKSDLPQNSSALANPLSSHVKCTTRHSQCHIPSDASLRYPSHHDHSYAYPDRIHLPFCRTLSRSPHRLICPCHFPSRPHLVDANPSLQPPLLWPTLPPTRRIPDRKFFHLARVRGGNH